MINVEKQIDVKIDFSIEHESVPYEVNESILYDQAKLLGFIEAYYDSSNINMTKYLMMINLAILNDNLLALETLWQGIYYNDRYNPRYAQNLILSSESSLKTFKHCLYAYLNYATLNEEPMVDKETFNEYLMNKEVKNYVAELPEFISREYN